MTDWNKIHLLEARVKYHEPKYSYRKGRVAYWDHVVKWAQHNHKHGAYTSAHQKLLKWEGLFKSEALELHKLQTELGKLRPKKQAWHMGGWVSPGTPYTWQRCDQGQDFQIPKYRAVVAPGNGICTQWAYDGPFPSGFGSPYAVLRFEDSIFHSEPIKKGYAPLWYAGHANRPLVHPGERFKAGQAIAILNNGFSSYWGWIEVGIWPPRGMSEGFVFKYLFEQTIWR